MKASCLVVLVMLVFTSPLVSRAERLILEVLASEDGVTWEDTGVYFQVPTTESHQKFKIRVVRPMVSVAGGSLPPNRTVNAGSADVAITVVKFKAVGEDFRLFQICLQLRGSYLAIEGGRVAVWDGNTQLGTAVFINGESQTAVIFDFPLTLVKGTEKNFTIRCDIGGTAIPGTTIAIDVNPGAERPEKKTVAVGIATGQTATLSGIAESQGVTVGN